MFAHFRHIAAAAGALAAFCGYAAAGQSKLDPETCNQLRGEQVKFVQSGILADLTRGAEWGKTNLSADRLREIEHYIMLDEQLKFGCREAVLTPDAARAAEIAKRIEINSDLDPTLPQQSGSAAATDDGASTAPADAPVKPKPHRTKPAAAKKSAPKAPPETAATPPGQPDAATRPKTKSAPVAETPPPPAKSAPTAVP